MLFFAYFIIVVAVVVKPSSSSSPTQQYTNLRKTKNLLLLCVVWFLIRNCNELPVLHLCKWISIYLDLPFKTSKIHSRCVFFSSLYLREQNNNERKKIDSHRKVSFAHIQTVTIHNTNKVKLNFVIFWCWFCVFNVDRNQFSDAKIWHSVWFSTKKNGGNYSICMNGIYNTVEMKQQRQTKAQKNEW